MIPLLASASRSASFRDRSPIRTAASMSLWKLVLFSNHDLKQGLMLTVEAAPGTLRPILVEPSGILEEWKTLQATSGEHWEFLQNIVRECESQYPLGASFGRRLFVNGDDQIAVREDFHPDLLPSLPRPHSLAGPNGANFEITLTPISEVTNASKTPHSMTYQTSLVSFKDQLYVAKGPADNYSVDEVFAEVGILSSLSKHQSIIEPPVVLLTLSKEDDRVLGYLLKYYPNGNVRDYAINNLGRLNRNILCKWSAQISGVLRYLLYECNFKYVDIKPDNFLVDEDETRLILADFSDEGCTSWTSSPELFHGRLLNTTSTVDGKAVLTYTSPEPANTTPVPRLFSFPDIWPDEACEKAMVYSVGRTLWMIWEAIPVDRFTMVNFRSGDGFDPMCTVFTESTDSIPQEMKDLVLSCVNEDPNERPTLAEIEAFFSKIMA